MTSDTHVGLILALTVNGLAVSAYRDMVAVCQTAESGGFDSVWLCDHFAQSISTWTKIIL